MDKRSLKVFNIVAGANFLEILADQVLARFPTRETTRPPQTLSLTKLRKLPGYGFVLKSYRATRYSNTRFRSAAT